MGDGGTGAALVDIDLEVVVAVPFTVQSTLKRLELRVPLAQYTPCFPHVYA